METPPPVEPFIRVAEIEVNWGDARPIVDTLGAKFERVIEFHRSKGYRLHSFQLHRMLNSLGVTMEKIVAVFEKAS